MEHEHRLVSTMLRPDQGRHVAVCSCGWRSDPVSSAGVAGSLWDVHVDAAPHDDLLADAELLAATLLLRRIELAHTRASAVERRAELEMARHQLRSAIAAVRARSATSLAETVARAEGILTDADV